MREKNNCVICDVKVSNIKQHENTKKHRININKILISNEYFNQFCNICQVYIDNFIQHEKTNKH